MTHAQKAAEKVAAMFQSRSNCPPISDFEFVIREHCEKPAVDEATRELRKVMREMYDSAFPHPMENGAMYEAWQKAKKLLEK